MFTRVRGTQDFLDLRLFNFFVETTKKHLACHNFHEIATPILEQTELFKRSLGEETDVVSKEMFVIPSAGEEGEEKESLCLRPEATASTMRAFLNNHIETTPWKVFTYGPMFRKERPQKGRFRQFHQFNIEIIGTNSVAQDAYFITMLDRLFAEKFKMTHYALLLNYMGCPEDRKNFRETLNQFLEQHKDKLCATCLQRKERNIMRVFDCKNPTCQLLYANAPKITDSLCTTCAQEWETLQSLLRQLSVSFSHMPTLVRGLDYYGKTVFEFTSTQLGAQSSFAGGGRYDFLATALGGKTDQPSIGAGLGIERILLLLEQIPNLPLPTPPTMYAILPLTKEQIPLCLQVADELHAHGLCSQLFVEGDSMKSMMRQANKLGVQACIIIGPDEQAAGQATVKQMTTGQESKIAQRELVKHLKG